MFLMFGLGAIIYWLFTIWRLGLDHDGLALLFFTNVFVSQAADPAALLTRVAKTDGHSHGT
jgi:hypothetical protein